MPIRFSSPKAVRTATAALVAAVLGAGATAVPATARPMDAPSIAYHLTGVSDAAQPGDAQPVAFSPGVSDAAQQTTTEPVAFSPGLSDAAQRAAEPPAPAPAPSVPRSTTVADDGIDWSSVVLGAGAAGLLLVGIGGALAITPKRRVAGHA